MKRVFSILLACLFILAGCSQSSGGGGLPSSGESLWGKKLSLEKVPVPQEAFDAGGAQWCCGIAPDGVSFLMAEGVSPYLYNEETKTKTDLVPADDAAAEAVKEELKRNAAESITDTGALQKEYDRIDALQGKDLTEELFSLRSDAPRGIRIPGFRFYTGENYLAGYTPNMMQLLIDCDSGKYYVSGKNQFVSAKDGRALINSPGQNLPLRVMELSSGQVTDTDLSNASGFGNSAAVKNAVFLDDGSICAVMWNMNTDLTKGGACVLAIQDKDGNSDTWSLGNILFSREPDIIAPVGTDYIILASTQFARTQPVYMVDRKEGRVYILVTKDMKVNALPLTEHQDGDGLPEDISSEGEPFIPLEVMADGETLLIWGTGSGEMLLYHPSTRETRSLVDPEYNGFPAPVYFSGNGYDRFQMNGWNDFTDYTQITVQ